MNKTDRELLKAAAKVAGLKVNIISGFEEGGTASFYLEPGQFYWNPLADDGDALRLAVRLKMRVTIDDDWSGAGWAEHQSAPTFDGKGPWCWKEWHYPMSGKDAGRVRDPYAATRRAIVRAAAAMGGSDE